MKFFTFILIAFLSFSTLNAQVEIKPGVKAGINIANLTNADGNGISSEGITSFHIGGTVSFKFADFYTLQPEILFSKQGSQLNINDSNDNTKVELNYLSIPINNKFYIGNSGLNFQIAPVLDILVSDKNIDSPEGFDLAIFGAVGYEIKNAVSVSIGYKQGLIDVFGRNVDTGNGAETTDVGDLILNKVIQLSVAYQFDF